jgi:hypothetical protein
MFEHDRFAFIGPAVAVVQAAISQNPNAGGARSVNFTVQAGQVTQQDVSDFTLLAAQQPEGLTLTIRTEALRVDETDGNGQTTVILQDGEPIAELGVAMEDELQSAMPVENKLVDLLRATAQRFNIPVTEEKAEQALAVENFTSVFEGAPGMMGALPSGAQFVTGRAADIRHGYYAQPDINRVEEDSDFFTDLVGNRSKYPERISIIIATENPSDLDVPAPLDEVSRLQGVAVYLVKPGQVKTSISAANESLRTSWNIKVPSIRRARLRKVQS